MNKSETKYRNTASLMDQALLTLIDKKEFKYITIKEICQKAGVNRSTFYLHYQNTHDLLIETIDYLIDQLRKQYDESFVFDANKDSLDNLMLFTKNYSIPYLRYIKEYKKAFMAIVNYPDVFKVKNIYDEIYFKLFKPILLRFNVPIDEQRYMIRFYISGIHGIIIEWIKNNCNEEVEFIANLIEKCIKR